MATRKAGKKAAAAKRKGKASADRATQLAFRAALRFMGGRASELGRCLGVSPSTIRDWQKRGVPASRGPDYARDLRSCVDIEKEVRTYRRGVAKAVEKRLSSALDLALTEGAPAGASKKDAARLVAKALGVTPLTVERWRKKGAVPPTQRAKLQAYVRTLKTREARTKERKRQKRELQALLKEARKEGVLKKYTTRQGARVWPRTEGYAWQLSLHAELDPDLILEIEQWASQLKGSTQHPLWQALAKASEYGRDVPFAGSQPQPIQLQAVGTGDFSVDSNIGGKVFSSQSTAISSLVDALRRADDSGLLVYVHAVIVTSFRRRTEPERRAFVTQARRKREKKLARSKSGRK